MKKYIFLRILLILLGINTIINISQAQVPNYVSTNGLAGWWPFNGNANDESGNGNNGTTSGAALNRDRFGILDASYSFDGIDDAITIPAVAILLPSKISISCWVKSPEQFQGPTSHIIRSRFFGYILFLDSINKTLNFQLHHSEAELDWTITSYNITKWNTNSWHHIVGTFDGIMNRLYIDGVLVDQKSAKVPQIIYSSDGLVVFGRDGNTAGIPGASHYSGILDDIGIWNRALTEEEINDLYNAVNCFKDLVVSPENNELTLGETATFKASTSAPNPSLEWLSDFGQGFQTLNNYGSYSGAKSNFLSISNLTLSNHRQPIRAVSKYSECIDTSNIAFISIIDTCISKVTIFDTLFTTVTDTLLINLKLTSNNLPNNFNRIRIYPNPAKTHLTIDYGNYSAMKGYTLEIFNSIGQKIYVASVDQQSSIVDLSTWTGVGIYFLNLIDPAKNIITQRKIVIQ